SAGADRRERRAVHDGDTGRRRRVLADGVAEAEEDAADDRGGKEDPQQLAGAERDFGVLHVLHVIAHLFLSMICLIPARMSTGTGKTIVVFFSTPISVSVCR